VLVTGPPKPSTAGWWGFWHPSWVRRGEIWQYRPVLERPGQSLLRLIVSADFVNEGDGATVLGVHLVDRDPQSLLAPRIGAHGFANVMTIEAVLRRRLDTRIALVSLEEMEQVSNALRAAQDL
jgi:mRNA-degrading endonuclease toxin of MazEF toxin-antitoxin module